MRGGRAKQHTIGNNAGAAPADFQHTQEQRKEKQFCFLGLADLQQVGGYGVRVQAALERRIGENQRVFFLVRVLVAQAVAVLNIRVVNAVGHHVHGADAQHGAVHIVAEEHVIHVMIFFLAVKENFFLAVFFQVLARCDEEAGRAAGGVADDLVRLGVHQLDHHFDNMARRAELTVQAGLRDFGQQIFVGVAAHIHRLRLIHQAVNFVQRVHHFGQQQRRGQLENGVVHVFGVGAVLVTVQIFDEREHPFLHGGVHFLRRKVVEHAPLELLTVDGALAELHFVRENALVRQPQHGSFLGAQVVGIVQVVNKH